MIHYFDSTMVDAPVYLNNQTAWEGVLTGCLVTGFHSVSVDSIAVAGGVATATVAAGHGFKDCSLGAGPVLEIAGVTSPAALNGKHPSEIIDSTHFSFTTAAPDGAASGSITAKVAGAGWTKPFGTGEVAVYQSPVDSAAFYRLSRASTTNLPITISIRSGMTTQDDGTVATTTTDSYMCYTGDAGTTYPWMLLAGDTSFIFLPVGVASYLDIFSPLWCGWPDGAPSGHYSPATAGNPILPGYAYGVGEFTSGQTFVRRAWNYDGSIANTGMDAHGFTAVAPLPSLPDTYGQVHLYQFPLQPATTGILGTFPFLWGYFHSGTGAKGIFPATHPNGRRGVRFPLQRAGAGTFYWVWAPVED